MKRLIRTVLASTIVLSPINYAYAQEYITLEQEEKFFDTDGSAAQYHLFLQKPFAHKPKFDGFILGMEKSDKETIKYPAHKNIDTKRLREWTDNDGAFAKQNRKARNKYLEFILDDKKSVFVSHIIGYQKKPASDPKLVYSAYQNTGFPDHLNNQSCQTGLQEKEYYENSWASLDCLFTELDGKLSTNNYTHLVIASMGWNNNQEESLKRYNYLISNTLAHTDESRFNPLVVGFTWPSVWSGKSRIKIKNLSGHIGSYLNKSNDADEIGLTLANHLVNNIVPRLSAKHTFSTLLIGHSMGARLLSRAMLSGHLLKDRPASLTTRKDNPLFLGLQPALDAGRFKEDTNVIGRVASIFPGKITPYTGEGAPYVNFRDVTGRIIFTTSDKDRANPFAQFLTGAKHIGGRTGRRQAQKEISHNLHVKTLAARAASAAECSQMKATDKVIIINATEFVDDHNDIKKKKMGKFLWSMIDCFQG